MSSDHVPEVRRTLTAFERAPGDALVGEWPLRRIELHELQALFGVPADNPMYDSWAVTPDHVQRLQQAVDHEIDLDAFDYFVEANRAGDNE